MSESERRPLSNTATEPGLQIYDGHGNYDYWVLEDPETTTEWIRAHKHDFVDVGANR